MGLPQWGPLNGLRSPPRPRNRRWRDPWRKLCPQETRQGLERKRVPLSLRRLGFGSWGACPRDRPFTDRYVVWRFFFFFWGGKAPVWECSCFWYTSITNLQERGNGKKEGACPSLPQTPHTQANLGLPFNPQVVHALRHYALMSSCTRACTHTHMHAHACHIHQHPLSLRYLLRQKMGTPPSPSSSAPKSPFSPQVPSTQPQAWHTLAFPGFWEEE